MLIAGLDPSLSNFGMVKGTLLFNEAGLPCDYYISDLQLVSPQSDKKHAKVVRKNSDDLQRAKQLHNAMIAFLEDVDLVMVEVPHGSQSARSMASYGICIGVLSAIQKPMIQLTATEVKLAAVNNKNATKQQMIDWATSTFPYAGWLTQNRNGKPVLTNKNEHLADATAAVVAGVKTETFKQLLTFRKSL